MGPPDVVVGVILMVVPANKHLRSFLPSLALGLTGCVSAADARGAGHELVVADDAGAELWRGQASYVIRPPARVVGLPGLGELQVTEAGCRFVWSREGLDRLVVLPGEGACAQTEVRRVCFTDARFRGEGRALVVRGCADENDLLESRLGAAREASVGPVDWRRRCAPLPARGRGCEVTYVGVRRVAVDENADAAQSFSFSWDGDRFAGCFLERDAGPYRIELYVEDSCGANGPVTLRGHSADLD